LRGLFVTGTDTAVGKTVLAAAIVAALRAQGRAVTALKPVITGLDEPTPPGWPHDHELLARVAAQRPSDVAPLAYGPAVSPHLAARLSGRSLSGEEIEAAARQAARGAELLIVEGVGGLLVPLTDTYDARALARRLGMSLVIAARPGLGTINHTLLTLEAARTAGLDVVGVVLTPWPGEPGVIERSNRETIARAGEIPVAVLPLIERAEPQLLAQAGGCLPLERWLGSASRRDDGSAPSARSITPGSRAELPQPRASR
jgi:dethiobiotin synthetase